MGEFSLKLTPLIFFQLGEFRFDVYIRNRRKILYLQPEFAESLQFFSNKTTFKFIKIMPDWCAVPGCTNEHAEHRFPINKQRKRQWEIAIKREDGAKSRKERLGRLTGLTKYDRVCSKHFSEKV